jgi:hypothetical protein
MEKWKQVGDLLQTSWGYNDGIKETMHWVAKDHDRTIRAEVLDTTRVVLQPFNEVCIDMLPSGDYTIGTEPMWITDRLMALGLMEIPPPPRPIDGVGLRLSATVFWIIAPTKD